MEVPWVKWLLRGQDSPRWVPKLGGWRAVLAPLQAQAELGLCPTFSLLEGQPAALSSLLSLPPAHSPPRFWLSPEQGGGVQGREPLGSP